MCWYVDAPYLSFGAKYSKKAGASADAPRCKFRPALQTERPPSPRNLVRCGSRLFRSIPRKIGRDFASMNCVDEGGVIAFGLIAVAFGPGREGFVQYCRIAAITGDASRVACAGMSACQDR